jgi:Skp family chaperone for outer membrane proteins
MLLSRKQALFCKRPLFLMAAAAALFAITAATLLAPSEAYSQQQPTGFGQQPTGFGQQPGASAFGQQPQAMSFGQQSTAPPQHAIGAGQPPAGLKQDPGQYSPQNAATHGVAVVDISFIFKNHARFKAAMENMKKEMENIEAQLKGKRDEIAKIEEKRNTYTTGSNEYKQVDDQLTRAMADFNVEMTRIRKDFLDREAKEYYKTYLEIVDAVGLYATQRNIGLVIRYNGDPVDPNRREDVLREINKPVVFQNRIDITGEVLRALNRDIGMQQTGAPGAPAGTMLPRR